MPIHEADISASRLLAGREVTRPDSVSIASLVITWALSVPLLYYCIKGSVRFNASFSSDLLASNLDAGASDNRARAAAILIVLISCAILVRKLPSIFTLLTKNLSLVYLCCLADISILWSVAPWSTFLHGLYITINLFITGYIVERFSLSEQMQLLRIIGWVAVLGSICAAILVPAYGVDPKGNWIGIFYHKNICAVMVTFLLTTALYNKTSGGLSRFSRFIYITASLFLIAMTQSRTGWLLAAFLFAVWIAFKAIAAFRGKDRAVIVFLIVSFCLIVTGFALTYYAQIITLLGKDSTLSGRTEIFAAMLQVIFARPLVGYGYIAYFYGPHNFILGVSTDPQSPQQALDNGYLGLWLDLGAIGILLLGMVLLRAWRDILICIRNGRAEQVGWHVSIIMLAIASNTVERMFLLPNYLAWIMCMMACLGLRQEVLKSQDQEAA